MEVVAIVGLGRSVDDEAPRLAADLGLTIYETAVMLRAPPPIIVFRSEDRSRTSDVLSKLRSRGHDAVACELSSVVSNDAMFRPRTFRFEGDELIGFASGSEQRLPMAAVFALLRAQHATRSEDTVETREHRLSLGRASMTGGLMMSKVHTKEERRVTFERESVLYVFRADGPPWLFCSMQMRYEGLGQAMRPSRLENFEVLQQMLRSLSPNAPYDTRLLAIRVAASKVVTQGPGHMSASSAATIDLMAHILTLSLNRAQTPYR